MSKMFCPTNLFSQTMIIYACVGSRAMVIPKMWEQRSAIDKPLMTNMIKDIAAPQTTVKGKTDWPFTTYELKVHQRTSSSCHTGSERHWLKIDKRQQKEACWSYFKDESNVQQ